MKNILTLSFLLLTILCNAQVAEKLQPSKKSSTYIATAGENIFSIGIVGSDSFDVNPRLRFSSWFSTGVQIHHNFNNSFGIFSGINIKNVGMNTSTDVKIDNTTQNIRLKHRVYSAGIPLALKFGDFKKKVAVAIGGEAEFFLNYKVKEFIDGDKIYKRNEWFSSKVELFNPSAFVQFNFGKSFTIKAKYYLNNFLVPQNFYILHDGPDETTKTQIATYTQSTQLFYISLGTTMKQKKKGGTRNIKTS
jgi:hypothetical protein